MIQVESIDVDVDPHELPRKSYGLPREAAHHATETTWDVLESLVTQDLRGKHVGGFSIEG